MVNVRSFSNCFLLVFLVTIRVSLEELCLPSFEVLNCWLNLVASCLDDENELPLNIINSFSVSRFPLPSIPLIVLHSLVRSVFWSMVSTKCLHFSRLCTQMRYGCLYSILTGYLVCSSRPVSHGVCPIGMWCDAAFGRTVRKIFSSLWQSVGRKLLHMAASTSCLYLSQLAFFRST